ncbi:MAG: response regulator [Cyanobacteriota bacterium]|nr:response regulator [Cyanobacteriota bacterium]
MSAYTKSCIKLAKTLATISKERVSGKLLVEGGTKKWQLYFLFGQLLYPCGSFHRARRWYRGMARYWPDFQLKAKLLEDERLWEYKLLHKGIEDDRLSLPRVKAMLGAIAYEVFFAIIQESNVTKTWHPLKPPNSQIAKSLLLSASELQPVFASINKLSQQWKEMGLSHVEPDFAPIIKESVNLSTHVKSDSFWLENKLLNGDNTIWDIAIEKKQPLCVTARSLNYFEKQGLIAFNKVPDLPSPMAKNKLVSAAVSSYNLTIACIDDSPLVGDFLEQILKPLGYTIIKIQDPFLGLPELEKHKPDLIFLDLVMPKVNGYNVCYFLRRTTMFQETPIVFLTVQDTIVDRTRAKLTGANDFLSKYAEADKVIQVVKKYVKTKEVTSKEPNVLYEPKKGLAPFPISS